MLKFKLLVIFIIFLCGCQTVKIEPSTETIKAGKNKEKFITGILVTLPFLDDQKILLKGAPHKDPNHNEIIRQEYLTSIKF